MKLFPFIILMVLAFFQCNSGKSETVDSHRVVSTALIQNRIPLFIDRTDNNLMELNVQIGEGDEPLVLAGVDLCFTEGSNLNGVAAISAILVGEKVPFFAKERVSSGIVRLRAVHELNAGKYLLNFIFEGQKRSDLLAKFQVKELKLRFKNHESISVATSDDWVYRSALTLRTQGQDKCDTYRIPGIVTTNQGTLIAVYDNRYNSSKDLQEDIDIGMSRSTDGGQSWQPMKVIMDMGEYGGRSQRLNGIGDPCVLYDHKTNTIWVAALWLSGSAPDQMVWWVSKPGMKPEETGQFMLTKSTDDGISWSQPINITEQVKNPAWQLLLQGPGRGITLSDGTLVFPAQFKADLGAKAIDGGKYTCHSTIVYSKDSGKSWNIGTGAKSNTTEAQVVQLGDGSLMLNMRDDRNRKDKSETNGRAVAVTTDLGNNWTVHSSSNSALPEPNCMASIIRATIIINGEKRPVLFFSNPNNKNDRTNMTIKASLDEGKTWPESQQIELNAVGGYGYSCLTMVDKNTVGILYEGVKELFFQKILVNDILKNK